RSGGVGGGGAVRGPPVAQVGATTVVVPPPATGCTGVPSPQSIASVNPAAVSAAEGSVVENVASVRIPASVPGGTVIDPNVGATLVIVSVASSVATVGPSVTRTDTVRADGPSP